MAACVRRVSTLVAVLGVAAVLVPVGSAGLQASASFKHSATSQAQPGQAALPTLYVVYTLNCTFSIVDDAGKPVNSIPPGSYQVEVSTPIMFKLVVPGGEAVDRPAANDFTGCKGWVQFQLTGPGVNLSTTLDSGCDAFLLLPVTTFKENSTYTAQDNNQPSVTRTALTVLGSGSPAIPVTPYGSTSGKGTLSTDLVGSKRAVFRGTLNGTLSANGKAALTSKGKPISTLKTGSYTFAITDQSPKRSFTIGALKKGSTELQKGAKTLTGGKFVGKNSVTVTLKAGRWMYYSAAGRGYYFLVTH